MKTRYNKISNIEISQSPVTHELGQLLLCVFVGACCETGRLARHRGWHSLRLCPVRVGLESVRVAWGHHTVCVPKTREGEGTCEMRAGGRELRCEFSLLIAISAPSLFVLHQVLSIRVMEQRGSVCVC